MTLPTRTRTAWMSLLILAALVLGVSNLLARPATRIDPLRVDPVSAIDERMIMVVSNESPFQPNSLCASCHMELFDQWTSSIHYQAWREPVFQALYTDYQLYLNSEEYYEEPTEVEDIEGLNEREIRRLRWREAHRPATAGEVQVPIFRIQDIEGQISVQTHGDGLMADGIYDGKVHVNCMRCHAPGADFTKDKNLFLENNIDGIFCDYCHTIVDYTETEGYVLYWSHIKQGPRMFATTSSHALEYSRLSESSLFCRGCHQFENPWGLAVYDTYNQWFNSQYANPANTIHCQSCHMPPYPGRASLRGDWRPDVRSHALGGGHDYDFMLETATVEIATDIQGNELYIDVDVANARAGHNYPTSNGMRQLILVVRLKGSAGETLWEGKRVYERVLGDACGNPTFEIWRASEILSDTTLLPGEIRTESFVVPMPDTGDNLYVTAQLFYRLAPEDAAIGTAYLISPYRIDYATQFIQ